MSSLQISQGTFRLSDTKTLNIEQLCVQAGELGFRRQQRQREVGPARALSGELTLLSGQRENTFARVTALLNSCRSWSAMSGSATTRTCSARRRRYRTHDSGNYPEMRLKTPPAAPCRTVRYQPPARAPLYLSTGETRKTLLYRR